MCQLIAQLTLLLLHGDRDLASDQQEQGTVQALPNICAFGQKIILSALQSFHPDPCEDANMLGPKTVLP